LHELRCFSSHSLPPRSLPPPSSSSPSSPLPPSLPPSLPPARDVLRWEGSCTLDCWKGEGRGQGGLEGDSRAGPPTTMTPS
jgi:hypothetical protein